MSDNPEARPVVVVGGGIAGLFTGVELKRRGVPVLVLEGADRPGGVARSIVSDGYTLEPAAGTLMLPHPALSPLLAEIGAEMKPAAPAAKIRYVYTGRRLVEIPASPKVIVAPLVSPLAKLRAAAEPLVRTRPPVGDESLDGFMKRRFGRGMGEMAAWLAASGVFAGDPRRLSASAAFPAITGLEDEGGSVIRGGIGRARKRPAGTPRAGAHYPAGGMTALAEAAATHLGDAFRPRFEVESVTRTSGGWRVAGTDTIDASQVVVAVRPERAATVLGGDLGDVLDEAVSTPVVVAAMGGTPSEVPIPEGFGALIGPAAGLHTRGILFESSYAPDRAPVGHNLTKIIAGGRIHPELVEWGDRELTDLLCSEAERVLGSRFEPSHVEIVRHRPGIPQYELGHRSWLERIDEALSANPGLHLTGWGYRGVGVSHLAVDALATADRVTA
ncbi:MAG TPA: protoporphyrinogen oxidase [Acidimicrobiales bacterium]|nr:protoporphyrinogen oxidase [Acidimicrobiales bacterium]